MSKNKLEKIKKKISHLVKVAHMRLRIALRKIPYKNNPPLFLSRYISNQTFERFGTLIITTVIIVLLFIAFVLWTLFTPLPPLENFQNRAVAGSTKIYDRSGKVLLYDLSNSARKTKVTLDEVSPHIKNATIAVEDKDFYKHEGFQTSSLLRAVITNAKSGRFKQGGSTITQQVVKNSLLSNKKSILRKVREIILAIKLETMYSKDQIFGIYLNETPYGGIIYGVEEASQSFFGKKSKDVTIAEAAYIAALPKGPSLYSPYGAHRDQLEERKNMILQEMLKEKYITQEEYNKALQEKVIFKEKGSQGIKAPHFVFFIQKYLIDTYGKEVVAKGGMEIITTLDWTLQEKAEEIVTRKALENARRLNASNAGLVAIDPTTGQILAMVGSRGYSDEKIQGKVNVTTSKRQPGSSFKPFAYATAFKKGYTPETIIFDLKTQFSTRCRPDEFSSTPPCYAPSNYGDKIHGPITMKNALAQSVNIAAVKVLYLAGLEDSIQTAESLGITTLSDRSRFGLSLVLGGGEVTLLEMTSAYSVFANEGIRNPYTGILSIKDKDGKILESFVSSSSPVLDPEIARTISDILSDNNARAPEFGYNSPLHFSYADVAAKTGTTNDYRDAWIVGYTPKIAIGVWAGNNDNTPMYARIAEASAAPLWHEAMAYAINRYPGGSFTEPQPTNTLELHPIMKGDWNPDPSLGVHDTLFWINKDNPQTGEPTREKDPQFYFWEYPVLLWNYQRQLELLGSTTPATTTPGTISIGI